MIVTHHLDLTELANKYPQIVNLTTEVDNKGNPTYHIIEGVFNPSSTKIKLEYPPGKIRSVIPESHEIRLKRMLGKKISDKERERIYELFPRLKSN